VNHRALEYYDSQGDNLSPDSRANRALVLLALGEDDETRGARQSAVDKFKEAYSTTSALLSAEPNNPERVFDHAQSVYWLGYDKYAGGDVAGAKKAFAEYRQLAERMISLAPREPRYLREQALAEGDLCSLDFLSPMNPKSALDWCTHALEHMNTAVHRMPPSSVNQVHLFNRYHWMADAYHINGDDVHARERRLTAEKIITQLMTADPVNMDYKIQWIALQRNLARGEVRAGDMDQAKTRLTHASAVMDLLVIIDPNNQEWSQQKHKLDAELTKIIASKEGN
ncbi:MAG TPA: hypothetical protein VMF58_01220, partial [Rhizomicrobium sp.]|nr:hypothetical protein [Rhizomicrobium sp.]